MAAHKDNSFGGRKWATTLTGKWNLNERIYQWYFYDVNIRKLKIWALKCMYILSISLRLIHGYALTNWIITVHYAKNTINKQTFGRNKSFFHVTHFLFWCCRSHLELSPLVSDSFKNPLWNIFTCFFFLCDWPRATNKYLELKLVPNLYRLFFMSTLLLNAVITRTYPLLMIQEVSAIENNFMKILLNLQIIISEQVNRK